MGGSRRASGRVILVGTSLWLLLGACASASRAPAVTPVEWRSYGNDPGGMRYSPLAEIDRGNVAQLTRAWTYHTGELQPRTETGVAPDARRPPPFETTPLVVDGVLYLSTPSTRVIALDAESGRELWTFDPYAGRERERMSGAHRGVSYWEGRGTSGARDRRILLATMDGRLIALDAATGRPVTTFASGGTLDLRAGMMNAPGAYGTNSPPAIYRDLVITGAVVPEGASRGPSGDVRAFDVRTGALVWRFHTVPRPGEPGHESWSPTAWQNRTGVNVWSIMTVDVERGLVFLPTGSASPDFFGGDRVGAGLYANSLVALDAATGRRRWHHQLVHHDIWDYDLPAPPALVTIRRGGREIPAVVQVTKSGLMFLFDRRDGTPLFPIEERAVPASRVPGESAWPTQPFPTKPAPLSRQTAITAADLTKVTPESRAFCSEMFARVANSTGVYTPIDTTMGIWFPGTLGGATWSGVSFDPVSGYAYVNVNEIGAVGALRPRTDASSGERTYDRTSPWGGYARFWDPNDLPCQHPPWGRLHAIDLATGDYVWSVPLGVNDSLLARGVGKTGAPNIGGSIVTAGGLVFIGGTNDRRFRAFDSRTGAELWSVRIEGSAHATPITYRGARTGRQFVVVAAGGGGFFNRDQADAVIAWALPSGVAAAPVPASAQSDVADKLPAADRIRLAEAFRLSDALGDSVWAGWSTAPFAVLLVTAEREFLLRHPRPSADFARIGHDSLLRTDVYWRPRTLSPTLLATFPAVGGVPTIVIGQVERTGLRSTAWVLTVLHEHFHQLQTSRPGYYTGVDSLGLERGDRTGMWMLNYPFPYGSVSVRTAFGAMTSALSASLLARPDSAGAHRLAVDAARRRLRDALSPDDHRYLEFQIWQEGLARYTELQMARIAARRFSASPALRALPDFTEYASEAESIERRLLAELRDLPLAEAKRVAFYPVGAAMALLLDATVPDWRARYFQHPFALDAHFH